MSASVIESTVEDASLSWFAELGYAVVHGPETAPGELFAERRSCADAAARFVSGHGFSRAVKDVEGIGL